MSNSSSALAGTAFEHAGLLDQHSQTHLLKPNQTLQNAIQNSKANHLPDITVSPLQGQQLSILARLVQAQEILEVGTLGGYSTIWLAQETGAKKVTSIEIDPQRRAVALQNTKDLPNVDILLGPALEVMPRLLKEGRRFDFCFVDASWGEQWECFELAVSLTRSGGCVYVDNVVREVLECEKEGKVLSGGKDTLIAKIGRDERVVATLIPTVGAHKGAGEMFDGVILAYVK